MVVWFGMFCFPWKIVREMLRRHEYFRSFFCLIFLRNNQDKQQSTFLIHVSMCPTTPYLLINQSTEIFNPTSLSSPVKFRSSKEWKTREISDMKIFLILFILTTDGKTDKHCHPLRVQSSPGSYKVNETFQRSRVRVLGERQKTPKSRLISRSNRVCHDLCWTLLFMLPY